MKITQDIRDAARAGMQDKASEFRASGGEIYVPEIRQVVLGAATEGPGAEPEE